MDGKQVALFSVLLGAVGGMVAQIILNLFPPIGSPVVGAKVAAREIRAQGVDGKSGIFMGADADGQPVFNLTDKTGTKRVVIGIDDQLGAHVRVCHSDGTTRAWMSINDTGQPLVGIANADGKSGALMEMSKTDKPAVLVRTRGTARSIMCVSEIGPSLNILDDDGTIRAVIGQTSLATKGTDRRELTMPGTITLFNKAGRVIWKSPGHQTILTNLDSALPIIEQSPKEKTKPTDPTKAKKPEAGTLEPSPVPMENAKPRPTAKQEPAGEMQAKQTPKLDPGPSVELTPAKPAPAVDKPKPAPEKPPVPAPDFTVERVEPKKDTDDDNKR
jgi:hypothetical protein